MTITLKGIIDEDFVNYRVPSMTLEFPYCSFKCGASICQNYILSSEKNITIEIDTLCARYMSNYISEAVVCQGLEPLDSFNELLSFIRTLRQEYSCDDDIVIYTGYDKEEIKDKIAQIAEYRNIVIKYGRYIPNQKPHFDSLLEVNLASDNQYAERL